MHALHSHACGIEQTHLFPFEMIAVTTSGDHSRMIVSSLQSDLMEASPTADAANVGDSEC